MRTRQNLASQLGSHTAEPTEVASGQHVELGGWTGKFSSDDAPCRFTGRCLSGAR
jgi:hypothetical protein